MDVTATQRCRPPSIRTITPLLSAIALALFALLIGTGDAGAHAELVRAEPPIDGLVLAPPSQVTLTFSEEIAPNASLEILDAEGRAFGTSSLPVGANGNERQLIVNIGSLDPGTYTVTWSAESKVDGHRLDGTYAFRVGGGLPPGVATVEGENPAPWAVATRWLTFLGVSVVVGAFLFRLAIVPDTAETARWARRRSKLLIGGSVVGLLATISEPMLQFFLDDRGDSLRPLDIIWGLPAGWWWRPAMIAPLAVLGMIVAYPMRGRLLKPIAWIGLILGLASLLGLALTSHAAGRETWREIAVISNVLHQWSGALWLGGLVSLIAWLVPSMGSSPGATSERPPFARFSTLAIFLFGIAVLTGAINTGFVFPFVSDIRRDGFSAGAVDPLWTSQYGIVLLIKILVLVVPFVLAMMHRSAIRRTAGAAIDVASTLPGRFRKTLRMEAILVLLVVLGGSTIALSAPPPSVEPVRDDLTLVAPARTVDGQEPLLVHLTASPVRQGENNLVVRLTDWDGAEVGTEPAPRVMLDFLSLDHGVSKPGVSLEPGATAWSTSGLDLTLQGWWQVTASVTRDGMDDAVASFFLLLPDPNINGFDQGPKPSSSDEAEALFREGLASMTSWRSARWIEYLGSGDDVLVIGEFGVIDGEEQKPDAYEVKLRYSGGFAPFANGDPPRPPTHDSRHTITVGEQSWLATTGGQWLEGPAGRFDVPSQWAHIYEAGQNFRLGGTQTINGEEARIVTFYSPERTGQSEAWFAWWIGVETGNVLQITMVARQHYMMWQYTDINGDFAITAPVNP